ncbi:MAG: adenosylmethionine--8-amino-7-oxononanoate transaminase [Bacteroidetes bacterium]|nr:adenosylmethionine--8-amino-7-oxononanoate transaminase [Bacteroidota bacterium]
MNNWIEDGRNHIWHPFTQMKTAPAPLPVIRGEKEYLFLEDGTRLIDGISSWWVTLHGHSHPKIAEAIASQAKTLEQVIFAGFVHEPAAKLSKRLSVLWQNHLTRSFFSDDGSTAVEVALKMSIQSRVNQGNKKRNQIIALEHAYHGDTLGAMSVGERSIWTAPFHSLLFEVVRMPSPVAESGPSAEEHKQYCLDSLMSYLEFHHESVSAIIVEPLVHGASGMLMWAPGALSEIRKLTSKYGIHLIADEIMTGFGRTGKWFACNHEEVFPDIVCLSKGLTGGFLPMSITMCTEEIYEQFLSDDRMKAFFHGHSYTANPIACAAANASLDVFEEEKTLEKIVAIENLHQSRLKDYENHPLVADARIQGTIFAVEIKNPDGGYFSAIGPKLYDFYLKNGVLLRPLGNTVYILPPFCISPENLGKIHDLILESLNWILKEPV